MATTLNFYVGGFNIPIVNIANSGLGFFSSVGFGASIPVNAWSGSTYVTDGNGVNQGAACNNITWIHPASGTVQNGTNIALLNIANYQSTLNIRLNADTSVRTQNARMYIYDRVNINNAPSGVVVAVAPIIHPALSNATSGSGSSVWQYPTGSSYVNFSILSNGAGFSPGMSGFSPNGAATTSTQHDWFSAISVSPTTIGSKTNCGIFFQTEYL